MYSQTYSKIAVKNIVNVIFEYRRKGDDSSTIAIRSHFHFRHAVVYYCSMSDFISVS